MARFPSWAAATMRVASSRVARGTWSNTSPVPGLQTFIQPLSEASTHWSSMNIFILSSLSTNEIKKLPGSIGKPGKLWLGRISPTLGNSLGAFPDHGAKFHGSLESDALGRSGDADGSNGLSRIIQHRRSHTPDARLVLFLIQRKAHRANADQFGPQGSGRSLRMGSSGP